MSGNASIRGVKDLEDLPEFLRVFFGPSEGEIPDREIAPRGGETM